MKPRFIVWSCVVILAAACPRLRGQEAEPARSDGSEVFGMLLKARSLAAVNSLKVLEDSPEETMLVLFGDLSAWDHGLNDRDFDLLKYVKRGGALLVASGSPDRGRLAGFKVAIDGRTVRAIDVPDPQTAPAFPNSQYRLTFSNSSRDPACPLLTKIAKPFHPLWSNLLWRSFTQLSTPDLYVGLETNGPSFLIPEDGSPLVSLLEFPVSDAPYILASPADDRLKGRVIILAGQGVFFNSMMVRTGNDNLAFAWNCVGWLSNGPANVSRKFVLFVHDGRVVTTLELPKSIEPNLPGELPQPTSNLINRLLYFMEREQLVQDVLGHVISRPSGLRALFMFAALVLLVYGCWRLSRGRQRVEMHVPLIIDPVPPAEETATLLQQRHQALAKLDNYAEPAQTLARHWFWQHAGIAPDRWDEPGFQFPNCGIRGTWLQRFRRHRLLKQIRRLAEDVTAQATSGRQFRNLRKRLEVLNELILAGDLVVGERGA